MAMLLSLSCTGKKGAEGVVENTDSTAVAAGTDDSVPPATEGKMRSVECKKTVAVTENGEVEVKIKVVDTDGMDKPLAVSMRAWLGQELYLNAAEQDISKALEARVKIISDSLAKDLRDLLSFNPDVERKVIYTYEAEVKAGYEDAQYITLILTSYEYYGGAHGSSAEYGMTFSKNDGKCQGWNLVGKYDKRLLRSKIKEGLKTYFDLDKNSGEEELRRCLLIDDSQFDDDSFPLPETTPYLTEKGVCMKYQSYEIAPYAAGKPECFIPLTDSKR